MLDEPTKFIHVSDDDYKVGYGKPPNHTKFEKGKSGNPRGPRKKQKVSLYEDPVKTLLRGSLASAMDMRDKKMPAFLALLKVLFRNGILKGDTKAIQILFGQIKGLSAILDEEKREASEAQTAFLAGLRKEVDTWVIKNDGDDSDLDSNVVPIANKTVR